MVTIRMYIAVKGGVEIVALDHEAARRYCRASARRGITIVAVRPATETEVRAACGRLWTGGCAQLLYAWRGDAAAQ